MSIRRATPGDHHELVRLATHFASTVEPYRTLFDGIDIPAQCGLVIKLLFDLGERAAIFVAVDADDIPHAGIAICENMNVVTGELFADEITWWVEPEMRGGRRIGPQLMGAAELWATTRGLRSIKMVAPIPSTVGKFYERAGYQAIEVCYRKVL